MDEPKASVSQGIDQFVDDGGESVAIGEVASEGVSKEEKGSDAPAKEEESATDEPKKDEKGTSVDDGKKKEEPVIDDEDIPDDKLPKGVLKRLAKMRKLQGDSEREAERLKAENETLKRAHQVKEDIGKEPDPTDFETEIEYIKAFTKWEIKVANAEQETKRQEQEAADIKQRNEKEAEERHKEVQKQLKVAGEKYSDFSDVVYRKEVPITESMVDVMSRFDNMGDVAYYLGKHVEECLEIAQSGQTDQALSLKGISDSIKATEKKITKTPAPIRPISGTGAGIKDLETMSFPEFRKAMEKREKEARGG